MQSKWDALKGNPAFFAAAAACLLLVAAGGWYLLREEPAPVIPDTLPVETAAPAPIPQAQPDPEPVEPEPLPDPAPAPQAAVSMPEFIPDDTPVIVTPPRVVVAPLEGEVLTAFSVDQLVYSETLGDWRAHDGVDIAAAEGASVLAAGAGTVVSVADDPLMGTTVVIEHADGRRTTYANLQAGPAVEAGDKVAAGEPIGAVGQTAAAEAAQGPHLHFAVSKDGVPLDPGEYLK